jgi:hypothetical protein
MKEADTGGWRGVLVRHISQCGGEIDADRELVRRQAVARGMAELREHHEARLLQVQDVLQGEIKALSEQLTKALEEERRHRDAQDSQMRGEMADALRKESQERLALQELLHKEELARAHALADAQAALHKEAGERAQCLAAVRAEIQAADKSVDALRMETSERLGALSQDMAALDAKGVEAKFAVQAEVAEVRGMAARVEAALDSTREQSQEAVRHLKQETSAWQEAMRVDKEQVKELVVHDLARLEGQMAAVHNAHDTTQSTATSALSAAAAAQSVLCLVRLPTRSRTRVDWHACILALAFTCSGVAGAGAACNHAIMLACSVLSCACSWCVRASPCFCRAARGCLFLFSCAPPPHHPALARTHAGAQAAPDPPTQGPSTQLHVFFCMLWQAR